ncbi:hypothetical protein [Alteribacillus iranensis]|uniref:Cytosolic protein n=1 Tax=Alteribacillus iranensis TaxID=930128 RepID=A0A1I2EQU5_9BACI|nr:hypothetical protein [Alteribacillus iranensis]SFE94701.1 hypothetical protein SAMN05192532_106160 [Alteribacillus iranensis]
MERNFFKSRKLHEHPDNHRYTDVSNVEASKNFLVPEQTPEGPYGSPIDATFQKTTPWEEGQRPYSAFNYEFKAHHQNIPRQYPQSHPIHDEPGDQEEYLYTEK